MFGQDRRTGRGFRGVSGGTEGVLKKSIAANRANLANKQGKKSLLNMGKIPGAPGFAPFAKPACPVGRFAAIPGFFNNPTDTFHGG